MKRLLALLLFPLGCLAQSGSPFTNAIFPAQTFTATAQTGAVIQLNGQQLSYGAGTISLTGTSLTTATFAVQGSSDNGLTYYALPITAVTPGASPAATATATASGLYQVSLVGITHLRFVTSGTFTGTSISLTLTATPNATVSRSSGGTCGSNNIPCTNVANSFTANQVIVTAHPTLTMTDTSWFNITVFMGWEGNGAFYISSSPGLHTGLTFDQNTNGKIEFGNGSQSDSSALVEMGAIGSNVSSNTDLVGRLTLSSGTATFTFTNTYVTRPACFADDESATPTLATCVATTTGLTLHGTGSDVVAYHVVSFN